MAARARGCLLGRPKGALGKSKLDGKEEEIRTLLDKTVSRASIAKITGVSRTTLNHFIRTRKLSAEGVQKSKGGGTASERIPLRGIWMAPLLGPRLASLDTVPG